mmetsp:Transcript_25567/g.59524  ORF Transcript_25567/g.59524 Transcript_25567/m.59524 type:complete len:265 (+) Transcript_25567:335-1129(+)
MFLTVRSAFTATSSPSLTPSPASCTHTVPNETTFLNVDSCFNKSPAHSSATPGRQIACEVHCNDGLPMTDMANWSMATPSTASSGSRVSDGDASSNSRGGTEVGCSVSSCSSSCQDGLGSLLPLGVEGDRPALYNGKAPSTAAKMMPPRKSTGQDVLETAREASVQASGRSALSAASSQLSLSHGSGKGSGSGASCGGAPLSKVSTGFEANFTLDSATFPANPRSHSSCCAAGCLDCSGARMKQWALSSPPSECNRRSCSTPFS